MAANVPDNRPALKFRRDGSFRLVQYTDTHEGPVPDPRTTDAMNRVLDAEKPDLVVISGDCVCGEGFTTLDLLTRAIDRIAQPMESRRIPWAITFGNHDEEHVAGIGIGKSDLISMYMRYPHNLNEQGPSEIHGVGNANLLVHHSANDEPAFGVWLIDSNTYVPEEISGKIGAYDWVHFSQIKWYWGTSARLERDHGKFPSLMFMHIPLREVADMLNSGAAIGEQHEPVSPGVLNSGLFAAVLERGDVKGIFAGHDHVNTAVGDWYGVKLGFGGGIGYDTYGLPGDERDRLRGARVFTISENDPWSFETNYLLANSLE